MVIGIMKCDTEWNILAKKYLTCLDIMYGIKCFALLVFDSSDAILKCNIPMYYNQYVLAFQELNRNGLKRCKNAILWCNDQIKFRGKVLEHCHWSRDGI